MALATVQFNPAACYSLGNQHMANIKSHNFTRRLLCVCVCVFHRTPPLPSYLMPQPTHRVNNSSNKIISSPINCSSSATWWWRHWPLCSAAGVSCCTATPRTCPRRSSPATRGASRTCRGVRSLLPTGRRRAQCQRHPLDWEAIWWWWSTHAGGSTPPGRVAR